VNVRLVLLLAIAAVAVPAVALASGSEKEFQANLTGKVEMPKGAPAGKGTASVKITGTKVCWKFTGIKGIGTPLAAHIHKGGAGVSGPIVVPFGGKFRASGCIASTAAVVAAIAKDPKGYYVNVHTAKYPGGAIRGQLHADG
jgi:hypothetical protein